MSGSKLLEKYNKSFERSLSQGGERKNVVTDPFAVYKACLLGGTMECRFDSASREGDLSLIDENGITVVLPYDEFVKDAPYYTPKVKDRFIGLPLNVKVKRILESENMVIVVSAMQKSKIKGALIKAIFTELGKGNTPRVIGEVIHVQQERAMVNILHRDVLGFIYHKNWQNGYTRNMLSMVKPGDILEFDVIGQAPKKKGKDIAFILDRKSYAGDPWQELHDFEQGDAITVQCIEKPVNKSYFWGVSKRAPGIEVMCNYNSNLTIMKSCHYKCKVLEFSKDQHIFKVVPFEQVNIGIGTIENINYIKGGKKSQ